MPRGDGTGPMGYGPLTGKGLGFCAGDVPAGYNRQNAYRRAGRGMGLGRGIRKETGYGLGLGFGYGIRRFCVSPYSINTVGIDEKELLQGQKELLQNQLETINKQLEKL
jgi:hypothetical protein